MSSNIGRVIVVGAGPVGLWLACELRLAGVPTLVLERAQERSPHSKALGIHPRTIEVLAMRGLADPFLDGGMRVPGWHFGMLGERLDLRPLKTRFPFMLAHPQARTEELLERRAVELGAVIQRGRTVTRVVDEGPAVRVETAEGAERAAYVVGCDGAGSTVRESAGIEFPGTEATAYGYLGDVTLDQAPPPGFTRHNAGGALIVAPLPGGRHRVTGFDPVTQPAGAVPPTLEEVRAAATRVAGTDFGMRDPIWLSRFGNAARQAARYRQGRILLAGDAAHIHLPAGGVGLNVGLQDAMNLGWKLAAVARGLAPDALLDTYHDERHPVGAALLAGSLAQGALIAATSPEGQALRALLERLLATHPQVGLDLANTLSALDVAYPPAPGEHPLTGTRVPDLELKGAPAPHLFDLLHDAKPLLLNFTDPETPEIPEAAAALGVRTHQVTLTGDVDERWSTVRSTLVRPDGHVWVIRG